MTSAFGVSSGSVGEALNAYTGLNSYGTMLAAGDREDDDDTDPKGFITIMLFDKHHNLLDAAWDQMEDYEQTSTPPAKDPFDFLFKQMVVREEGYAYIFVSNENPTKVDIHFDDLKVTHAKSRVIQYSEYYPFGLQASTSWTRDNTKDNNFLYNASNELNKTSGWYEMFYRGYDPAIGRMLQVDPYAPMYANATTYNYALNNPVMMNDPSGGQTMEWQPGMSGDGVRRYNMMNSPGYAMNAWAEDFADYISRVELGGPWTLTIGNITINSAELPANSHTVITFQNGKPAAVSQGNFDTGSLIIAFLNTPDSFSKTGWGTVAQAKNLEGALKIAINFKKNDAELNNLILFSHGSEDGSEVHFGDVYEGGEGSNLRTADYAEGVYSTTKIIFNLLLDEVATNGNVVLIGCNLGREGTGLANKMQYDPDLRCDINIYVNQGGSHGRENVNPKTGEVIWEIFHMDSEKLGGSNWWNIQTGQKGLTVIVNSNGTITVK